MATKKRNQRIEHVVSQRQSGLTVVLEDIHDPHNALAIVRTCDALGIQDVKLIFKQQEGFNPRKVGKLSSSTANKWLSFETFRSPQECIQKLKDQNFAIIGTVMEGKEVESIYDADLRNERVALFLGNEHTGLSKTALRLCDKLLTIPMRGMVESLNVSVAAAICLYEIVRQRGDAERYRLNDAERSELTKHFLEK